MTPEHIVLHHSLTKDSKTVSWGAIRKYHMETLGWRDIGYHFGIERVGASVETFVGRTWDQSGAHCRARGMNHKSIGICFVGNFDAFSLPKNEWYACLRLCRALMDTFNIPKKNVLGHREIYPSKTCPGMQFDLNMFRMNL